MDVVRAVLVGDALDILALFTEKLFGGHKSHLGISAIIQTLNR